MGILVVLVVGASYTHLEDGEPLVVKVDAQGTLVRSVVAQSHHGRTYQVERDGKAPEQRYGVIVHTKHFQLRMGCSGASKEQQHTKNQG